MTSRTTLQEAGGAPSHSEQEPSHKDTSQESTTTTTGVAKEQEQSTQEQESTHKQQPSTETTHKEQGQQQHKQSDLVQSIQNLSMEPPSRNVMVAIDESSGSKKALLWALKHIIRPENDTLMLVSVSPQEGFYTEKTYGEEAGILFCVVIVGWCLWWY
jgi:primosomal protein N'